LADEMPRVQAAQLIDGTLNLVHRRLQAIEAL
jgi:phosphoglycerate-specific signal transduction histidine kinase